jgi:hypothetical protein
MKKNLKRHVPACEEAEGASETRLVSLIRKGAHEWESPTN